MALPDALERVGIVVGCTFLLALPTSALGALLLGSGAHPPWFVYLWAVPGFLVGVLMATDRLPVGYHQIWKFSLVSYFVAALGPWILGLEPATSRRTLAVGWWLVSVGVGVVAARTRFRESAAPSDE